MKLLVLLSRFPYPLDKGDKLRAYHQLRLLAERHTVALLVLADEPVTAEALARVKPLCQGGLSVHRLSRTGMARGVAAAMAAGLPMQVGYFQVPAAAAALRGLMADFRPDHVYCQLVRMAEYLRPYAGRVPMTIDYMDVFSAGMQRRAVGSPAWQRPVFRLEANRLRAYEATVFDWFTHHTIISEPDRRLIDHPQRDRIRVVPNGIDTAYFSPPVPRPAPQFDVLFCGNMAYYPNVEAAVFLAEEVLPLVRRRHPQARLLIAGTTPAPRVLALRSEAVHVSGWLPDIRSAYADARVFVAPMRSGTGLQNKLLEAMAMGLPSVTTPLAHSALGGRPDHEVLVGDGPEALAAHIGRLLADPALAARVGAAGQGFVQRHFDWEAATALLEDLLLLPAAPPAAVRKAGLG